MECRMDTFQIGLLVAIGLAVLLPGAILCFGISSEIARAKRRLNKPLVCDDCGTPDVRPSWPAGMQDRLMAASVGFQRHLAKPIVIEELLSTLKHLVEQHRGID